MASGLIKQLESERESAVKKLELIDKTIFRLYYSHALSAGVGAEAVASYKTVLSKCSELDERVRYLASRLEECAGLYSPMLTHDGAHAKINNMLRIRREMREELTSMLANDAYESYLTPSERKLIDQFTKDERDFLGQQSLNEEPVQLYGDALQLYQKTLAEHRFKLKKSLLDEQVKVIIRDVVSVG